MNNSGPTVSILVPTYNRHQLLVDTLKGLLIQEYEPKEIIVCDQSPDHPADVESFLQSVYSQIHHVREHPKDLVSAYRKCVDLASGDICLFIDDDVLISDRKLVSKHVRNYNDSQVGAVSGQVLHERQAETQAVDPRAYGSYGWMFIRYNIAQRLENLPSLCGANMSFRTPLYYQVGGFDLAYGGSGFRFETDFTLAIKALDYKVVFDPEASLVHRYQQPGGAENKHLFSLRDDSHEWYTQFFANTWYFLQKWYTIPIAIKLILPIWRQHVFNRSSLMIGPGFLIRRHRALLKGVYRGSKIADANYSTYT